MGVQSRRNRSLVRKAREKRLIGKAEVGAVVFTQTGPTAAQSAGSMTGSMGAEEVGLASSATPAVGTVHAIVATEAKLYVLEVHGLSDPHRVVYKEDLAAADVTEDGSALVIGGKTYNRLFFTKGDARALQRFLEDRAGAR